MSTTISDFLNAEESCLEEDAFLADWFANDSTNFTRSDSEGGSTYDDFVTIKPAIPRYSSTRDVFATGGWVDKQAASLGSLQIPISYVRRMIVAYVKPEVEDALWCFDDVFHGRRSGLGWNISEDDEYWWT